MLRRTRSAGAGANAQETQDARHAVVFAALGDATRLRLLARLAEGEPASIARLTEGSGLTRQAVTKHLRVLERSRMVRSARHGRESLYSLDPEPLVELRAYLEQMSRLWDDRLARLKAWVEEGR
jgi:DNA-binding transcriptional ArsR family regulator